MEAVTHDKPIKVHDERPVQMPVKTLAVLGCSVAALVGAYITMTRDIGDGRKTTEDHHRRLTLLENDATKQKELLLELRSDMKANREQTQLIVDLLRKDARGRE